MFPELRCPVLTSFRSYSRSQELGCSVTHLALAWVAKFPTTSTVILGASKPEQVVDNLKALDVIPKLTPDILEKIEKIVDNKPAPVVSPLQRSSLVRKSVHDDLHSLLGVGLHSIPLASCRLFCGLFNGITLSYLRFVTKSVPKYINETCIPRSPCTLRTRICWRAVQSINVQKPTGILDVSIL